MHSLIINQLSCVIPFYQRKKQNRIIKFITMFFRLLSELSLFHKLIYHMFLGLWSEISPFEPRHAKRVLRVILIKMFIFLFPECAFF